MSLLTFLLLWTLSFLPVLAEDLPTVQIKIIKEAKKCDVKAEAGDFLSVHYTGRFDDENGKVFDTSKDRGQLYKFQLGAGQVSFRKDYSRVPNKRVDMNFDPIDPLLLQFIGGSDPLTPHACS